MRTYKVMGIVGAAALLLSASVAFAEENTTNAVRESQKGEFRATTAATKQADIEKAARERAATVKTKQADIEKAARVRAAIATTTREELKQSAKERMETAREEAKTRVQAQKEKAKERLAEIQDKVRKQYAEKVASQFEKLNTTWTNHFMNLLEHYDAIVKKMQKRADIAAGNGKDVTAATTAIQTAVAAIETARTAVTAQAAKTYTLDATIITTTNATTTPNGQSELLRALKTSFQTMHSSLFADLFALRDGPMRAARSAVQAALQALGQVRGVDEGKTATTTASSNQ